MVDVESTSQENTGFFVAVVFQKVSFWIAQEWSPNSLENKRPDSKFKVSLGRKSEFMVFFGPESTKEIQTNVRKYPKI